MVVLDLDLTNFMENIFMRVAEFVFLYLVSELADLGAV